MKRAHLDDVDVGEDAMAPRKQNKGRTTKQDRKNAERRKENASQNPIRDFKRPPRLGSLGRGDILYARVEYRETDDYKRRPVIFQEAVDSDTAKVLPVYSKKRPLSRKIELSSGRESFIVFEAIEIPRVDITGRDIDGTFDESKYTESDYEFIRTLLSTVDVGSDDIFARDQFESLKRTNDSFDLKQIEDLEEKFESRATTRAKKAELTTLFQTATNADEAEAAKVALERAQREGLSLNEVERESFNRRGHNLDQRVAKAFADTSVGDTADSHEITLGNRAFLDEVQDPRELLSKSTKRSKVTRQGLKSKNAKMRAAKKRARRKRRKLG